MAALNLTALTSAGASEALAAAAAGGDSFPLNQPINLAFKNAGAGPRTITVVAQNPCNHGVLHNRVYTVPNDGITYRAVLTGTDLARFADAAGRVQLTYDAVAGLSVGASPATA
jgi:hypothetical protein